MKCVYCLDFPDGKRYVGSTKDLKRRLRNHKTPNYNKKTNLELKEAILEGGYEVIILEQCPDEYTKRQLEDREQHYVNLWFDYGILYNKHKCVVGSDKGWSSPLKGRPSPRRGKKYSQSYQCADKIRADRAAGMSCEALRAKYKTGINMIKDILSAEP